MTIVFKIFKLHIRKVRRWVGSRWHENIWGGLEAINVGHMHRDTYEPNDTMYLIRTNSKTFFFFRVAAAVVFDVSRNQTFHSVSKVSNKTV
jgi:hypothetical protein